jgi:hypothetical protein
MKAEAAQRLPLVMKYNNYTKYIPVTEEEYHAFKEKQRKEIKHVEEELTRPDALQPLVAAQNEKTRTLFEPTDNPELQEQRFAHLTSVINGLKRKVEEQLHVPTTTPSQPQPKVAKVVPIKTGREDALATALGEDVWTANGELVINGNVVPNSNKKELLKYAASNWVSKYANRMPAGGEQMRNLLREKNIPQNMWSIQLRGAVNQPAEEVQSTSSSAVQGFATGKTPKKKKKMMNISPAVTPYRNTDLERGLDLLNSGGKKFDAYMRKKKTTLQ